MYSYNVKFFISNTDIVVLNATIYEDTTYHFNEVKEGLALMKITSTCLLGLLQVNLE